MSLRGTLGDFGIADIFQLIGHQAKSGILLLKDKDVEVRIWFVDGNVVKAEQSSRERAELLGTMMVRSGAMTQQQLDEALAAQQRTQRRLGDILVETKAVTRATLKEFARLQTTESIYRLFSWRTGTYEFAAQTVEYDEQSYEPIRSENILMEGFRMVDEWPAVRAIIPHARCTFDVLLPLPPPSDKGDSDDLGLDDAFGIDNGKKKAKKKASVGPAGRTVYALVAPGRSVVEITERSRLGEFETTKALASLVSGGYLKLHVPAHNGDDDAVPAGSVVVAIATRVAMYAVVAVVVGVIVRIGSSVDGGLLERSVPRVVDDPLFASQADAGLSRLRQALEVHRLAAGSYPESLDVLVQEGLLSSRALHAPFADPYAYRREDDGHSFRLALPLR